MRNLLRCSRGAAAFATVIAMVPLIGVIALGSEGATWYVTKQRAQNAADAAAYSGALTLSCTLGVSCNNETKTVSYRGKEFAAQNGFCNSGDTGYPGSACLATRPTQSVTITQTTWNGKPAVQAVVSQTQPTYLAGLLGLNTVQIGATAIAQVTITVNTTPPPACTSNCGCILQTEANPAGGIGLNMNNGVTVKLNTCGATVNATGNNALTVTGGAQLTAPSVSVAGGASVNNGGQINSKSSCSTNCSSTTGQNVADPYAAVAMPATPGNAIPTPSLSWGYNGTYTLSPGIWTGNVSFANGITYNLQPGIYFVKDGNFNIGAATVTGSGVTIVLTGSSPDKIGTVTIDNGANATLSAPTTGPTAGIAFFEDRSAKASNVNKFAGGYNMKITGALYFPNQVLSFSNGVTNNGVPCTQIIAGSISIVGGTTLNSTSCPAGMLAIGAKSTTTTTASVALVK